jgi:lipid-binding SYLF domain-containing protein
MWIEQQLTSIDIEVAMKNLTRVSVLTVTITTIAFVLAAAASAQSPLAPKAPQIDSNVTAALTQLYAENATARDLGTKAKAVLVFPEIKKGAFIVGAQFGYGSLRRGTDTVAYYRTGAASYGFQAGVKKFGYALFFMTDEALSYLDKSGGWAIGTGPSVVVVDQGVARSLTTTSMRADVYAFVFSQKGLMGGIGLEGSKITRITPGQ